MEEMRLQDYLDRLTEDDRDEFFATIAKIPNDTIDTAEFRRACYACDVDPDSFTQSVLDKLQRKLNQIT